MMLCTSNKQFQYLLLICIFSQMEHKLGNAKQTFKVFIHSQNSSTLDVIKKTFSIYLIVSICWNRILEQTVTASVSCKDRDWNSRQLLGCREIKWRSSMALNNSPMPEMRRRERGLINPGRVSQKEREEVVQK